VNEELQTVFKAVITVVNCVLRGRLFAKLCDDMEAERTALLATVKHADFLVAKCFIGYLN
jgi:hypothetical protein